MVLPMRMVHHRTTHRGHLRDGGQFYQPFLLEFALDAFRHAFGEPQGVDQRLIGDPLARVACTAGVEFIEERHMLLLHRFECHHGGLLLACLVPTGGRVAHPAPAIIPSGSGGEARRHVSAWSGLFPQDDVTPRHRLCPDWHAIHRRQGQADGGRPPRASLPQAGR
jgi:hypothetical protein